MPNAIKSMNIIETMNIIDSIMRLGATLWFPLVQQYIQVKSPSIKEGVEDSMWVSSGPYTIKGYMILLMFQKI